MTLRNKTLISISLTIVFLVVLLYVSSRLILLNGFARLEEENVLQNLESALNTIQNDVDALDAMVFDWASWDDTYAFVADGNQDYVDSNLVDETFPNIRLNFILYVNAAGDLVYGKGYDLQNEEQIPIPESLFEHTTGDSLLARHTETDSSIKGLVLLPEGPLIVASRPIPTSEEEGPIRGALIMARYLDDAEIELLTETSLIPFSVMHFEDEETASGLSESLSTEETATLVRRQGSDTIAGYARLDDIYGKPALVIETQPARGIYKQGERSILYFMFSLLAIGLVFGAVSLILLERSVLARLAYLNLSVDRIGATSDLSERVHVPGGDELSSLAQAINGMLSRLEQAQGEREKTELTLRQHAYTLAQLNQLGQRLTASLSQHQITAQLSRVLTEVIAVQGVSVWLLDEEKKEELVCWAACNQLGVEPEQSPVNLRVRADQGVVGWVMQHKESVIISDAASDDRHFAGVDEQTRFQTRSLLAVPLQVRGSVIGVLEMVNKIVGPFNEDDLNLTEALAASVAVAIDNAHLIGELRQYTVSLERQNAELDAFAHTVAHDLKNPLSGLTAFSTMLETEGTDMTNEAILQDIRIIARNAQRMGNIIDELLLLASVRKQEQVESKPLDMAPIVAEAQERLSSMIAQHRGEVTAPDEWPVAVGYSPWVQEVWVNYISNALKYGGRPPRVELGAMAQDGTVRFWVRDNGEGLTEEEQENLFTEFTRLHQVRAEGYGLGLSIVRRIVEKLGGDVGVESEVGAGSVFYFTLPADESQNTQTEE
ncbi:MAG: GAF domain-containing protein [Anaerolineae bacterium]|nr:GAF domain-containing protein [Anaerolineae bacterium]